MLLGLYCFIFIQTILKKRKRKKGKKRKLKKFKKN